MNRYGVISQRHHPIGSGRTSIVLGAAVYSPCAPGLPLSKVREWNSDADTVSKSTSSPKMERHQSQRG
jgi:hypothetical protein